MGDREVQIISVAHDGGAVGGSTEPGLLEQALPSMCQECGETIGAGSFVILALTDGGSVHVGPGAPHWQADRIAGLASLGLDLDGDGLAECPSCGSVETVLSLIAAKEAELAGMSAGLRPFLVRLDRESAVVWAKDEAAVERVVREEAGSIRGPSSRRRILTRACRGMTGVALALFATAGTA